MREGSHGEQFLQGGRVEEEARRRRPELGSCLAGKYEVEKLLGEGSMGAVYAARNAATGKRVAIKWLIAERNTDFALVDRFRREARAAGRIDHPNVVTIFDVGNDDNAVFLVMELLQGEPLSDLLMRGPLEPLEAVGLMIPVLRGVAAAHAAGVVHRDLKPENIFICKAPDGSLREPKVLDFGISKLVGEAALEELRATRTGVVVGTPTYMSPEQIAGAPDIDERIDVYAAGVMLYEMLAGRAPFTAGTYTALVVQIATATPPDLRELRPDIDPELAWVIEQAMARDRDERFADVASLAEALEPFGAGMRFRPEAPAWSRRVSSGRHGSTKFTATDERDAVRESSIRESAPTVAAPASDPSMLALAGEANDDEPPVSGTRPSTPLYDSTDPALEPIAEIPSRRRGLALGAAAGALLLLGGLAVGIAMRDEPEPPAPQASAPEVAEEAPVPELAAEPPVEVAPVVAAPLEEPETPAVEPEPEPAPAVMRRAARRRATAGRMTGMSAEPVAVAPMVEATMETPAPMVETPTMEPPTPMRPTMTPRAGSLSVDEF